MKPNDTKNTSPDLKSNEKNPEVNEAKQESADQALKLLHSSRAALTVSFQEFRQRNQDYLKQADLARDEMLRADGAIKNLDVLITQLTPKKEK